MTPPPTALIEETSNNQLVSERWVVGSLATSTHFQPVSAPNPSRLLYIPGHLPSAIEHSCREPFESISSQVLFSPDKFRPAPSGESTESPVPVDQWLEPVVNRLDNLLSLPAGWDHHGAPVIDPTDVLSAFQFLRATLLPTSPAPAIVPISGGGVQLEWHRSGLDVEVLVVGRSAAELYLCEIESGREWEGPAESGFAEHNLAERLAE